MLPNDLDIRKYFTLYSKMQVNLLLAIRELNIQCYILAADFWFCKRPTGRECWNRKVFKISEGQGTYIYLYAFTHVVNDYFFSTCPSPVLGVRHSTVNKPSRSFPSRSFKSGVSDRTYPLSKRQCWNDQGTKRVSYSGKAQAIRSGSPIKISWVDWGLCTCASFSTSSLYLYLFSILFCPVLCPGG